MKKIREWRSQGAWSTDS